MPSIRITSFGGMTPALNKRLIERTNAEVAHNCLLWDGRLRPMPEWSILRGGGGSVDSSDKMDYVGLTTHPRTGEFVYDPRNKELVVLEDAPFPRLKLGIGRYSAQGGDHTLGPVRDTENDHQLGTRAPQLGGTVTYSAQNLSQKPVNRILGISVVSRKHDAYYESPLAVFPGQSPYGIMFEGDIVGIQGNISVTSPTPTYINIYRTIAGLDSGEQAVNQFDTDWHLVAQIPYSTSFTFYDGGAATTDPMDLYLAKNFYPCEEYHNFTGLLESGWVWAGNRSGLIDYCERYMPFAWPTENRLKLPVNVTAMKSSGDNIYVGTVKEPYVVSISPGEGEQGAQGAARAFPESLPCFPRTMSPTPSGVVYASPMGLISLSKSGARNLTAGLFHQGAEFYHTAQWEYDPYEDAEVLKKKPHLYEDTAFGINWNGQYFGSIALSIEYYGGES